MFGRRWLPLTCAALVGVAGTSKPTSAQAVSGQVTGRVTDAVSGASLSGVVVRVEGSRVSARSDTEGRFHLTGLPPGETRLGLRLAGYQPIDLRVWVASDSVTSLPDNVLALRPAGALVLDTVLTTGRTPDRKLADFYARRRVGFGSFLTRDEWERRGAPRQLTDVLQSMKGLRVRPNPNYGKPARWGSPDTRRWLVGSQRGPVSFRSTGPGNGECTPVFFLDGQRMPEAQEGDINDIFSLEHVEAIEAYSGSGGLPAEYNVQGSTCGVILLWTRTGRERP